MLLAATTQHPTSRPSRSLKNLPSRSHLDAAELALQEAARPLSAKELVDAILRAGLAEMTGATPWKTINARLSSDILDKKSLSRFKRTYYGRFALRSWTYEPEFEVPRRSLNPLDETIKAVPRPDFDRLNQNVPHRLGNANVKELIAGAIDVHRLEAEARHDLVQIIPTFVIDNGDAVLSFKRTKRLPEARLHDTRCLNFGGHMQSDDAPLLFWDDQLVFQHFLLRELNEELSFSEPPSLIQYKGTLYLDGNEFERQHVGLVHTVIVSSETGIDSLEPGMHTDLNFIAKTDLADAAKNVDSWSAYLAQALYAD